MAAVRSSIQTQVLGAWAGSGGVSTIPAIGTSGGTALSVAKPARSYAITMSAPAGSTARSTASFTSAGVPDSTTRTPRAKPAARVASSMPSNAAAGPYNRVLDVSTVTAWTGPPARARAARLGRNPSPAMASSTSWRVEALTLGLSFMTLETVWYETPAARATSRMLTEAGRSRLAPREGGGPPGSPATTPAPLGPRVARVGRPGCVTGHSRLL